MEDHLGKPGVCARPDRKTIAKSVARQARSIGIVWSLLPGAVAVWVHIGKRAEGVKIPRKGDGIFREHHVHRHAPRHRVLEEISRHFRLDNDAAKFNRRNMIDGAGQRNGKSISVIAKQRGEGGACIFVLSWERLLGFHIGAVHSALNVTWVGPKPKKSRPCTPSATSSSAKPNQTVERNALGVNDLAAFNFRFAPAAALLRAVLFQRLADQTSAVIVIS
jgi:hypothetical protein